jgi:beta-lactamase regulating signal transducer with metallopeptidase domain
MMPALEVHSIARYASVHLLDSLLQGTVIGGFAAVLLRLSRRQHASTRFAIGFWALIAIAVLPLLGDAWPNRGASGVLSRQPALVVPESWALCLFWTWAIVAAGSLFLVGRALRHLYALRKSVHPVDITTLSPRLQEILSGEPSGRKIALCTSEKVRVPTAIGLAKPAILIPGWVLQELSPDELTQIVLHELAHLRRWDDWTNLAQQLVKAIFIFHPAVWWIEKKLAFERESACDEAVVAQTSSPRAYAECLAHLAERSFVQRSAAALAQAVLGRVSQVSLRVAQILDGNRSCGDGRSCKLALSLAGGLAVVCAVGISKAPPLIAFEDGAPAVSEGVFSPAASVQLGATNASLRTPPTASLSALQKPILTKWTGQPNQTDDTQRLAHKSVLRQPAFVAHFATGRQNSRGMIYLASMQSSPTVQTVVVVLESGDPNSPDEVYQVQMWRVTVLKTIVDSTHHPAPRKEI